ncbi:hypothetical protein NPIL_253481 [Nephila pilipes]|uniref:Uncharacterized protein n=1 Tax=Nephila pilipes TaxID=299642 RepID=A0A8X6TNF0_NEPPI|nr:hypothetical protein NPIL_253481 [Nephila pilipes]
MKTVEYYGKGTIWKFRASRTFGKFTEEKPRSNEEEPSIRYERTIGSDDLLSVPVEVPSTSSYIKHWEVLQNMKRSFWKK